MSLKPAATTVGLLLAAGSGSRFDAQAPGAKLLQRIDGRTLVERALESLRASVDAVVVVTRDSFGVVRELASARDAHVVIAEDAALGMGHSLAAGIRGIQTHFPSAATVVVALADMPWVRIETIATLVARSQADDAIAQPRHAGQRGNPVAFPARFLEHLAASTGDSGARLLLREQGDAVLIVEVDDAGVLRDVDERSDLPS